NAPKSEGNQAIPRNAVQNDKSVHDRLRSKRRQIEVVFVRPGRIRVYPKTKWDDASLGSASASPNWPSSAFASGARASEAPWKATATCTEGKALIASSSSVSFPLTRGGSFTAGAGLPRLRTPENPNRSRSSLLVAA